jgi:cytochrome c peroxidase
VSSARIVPSRWSALGAALVVALGGASLGCSAPAEDGAYRWQLPSGMIPPAVPADNPMSEAKVELGRYLFFDRRLSVNGTQSCATCHEPARAFTDGVALPKGATGSLVPRNAMPLANVAYRSALTWANPVLLTLEEQALVPLTADAPVELGFHLARAAIVERLRADPRYARLFPEAFPDEADPYTASNLARAIASFERTIISRDSPYDRYVYGRDPGALSASAKRGMDAFFGEKLECYHCHSGQDLTDSMRTEATRGHSAHFENDGLYNVGNLGAYPEGNRGLREFTKRETDDGKFRVPSLRNIAVTAPYMHDGSIATLEEVVDMYAAGGRLLTSGPYAGDGRLHPQKSSFVRGFTLTAEERADLLAFLASLTDEAFLRDPKLQDPFR